MHLNFVGGGRTYEETFTFVQKLNQLFVFHSNKTVPSWEEAHLIGAHPAVVISTRVVFFFFFVDEWQHSSARCELLPAQQWQSQSLYETEISCKVDQSCWGHVQLEKEKKKKMAACCCLACHCDVGSWSYKRANIRPDYRLSTCRAKLILPSDSGWFPGASWGEGAVFGTGAGGQSTLWQETVDSEPDVRHLTVAS